jgi:hypothetical protein
METDHSKRWALRCGRFLKSMYLPRCRDQNHMNGVLRCDFSLAAALRQLDPSHSRPSGPGLGGGCGGRRKQTRAEESKQLLFVKPPRVETVAIADALQVANQRRRNERPRHSFSACETRRTGENEEPR